ncbi:MAG: hypothetical protein JNK04_23080 [Myxococcales bacterium]|nr:hypothetical protein [Myxococcales bacterium]
MSSWGVPVELSCLWLCGMLTACGSGELETFGRADRTAAFVATAPPTGTSTTTGTAASSAPARTVTDQPKGPYCVDPAKVRMPDSSPAAAPFGRCSSSLEMHCIGSHPKRHALCGYKFDPQGTEREQQTRPGVCCYHVRR